MKKNILFIELLALFFLILLPAITKLPEQTTTIKISFGFSSLFSACMGIFLYAQSRLLFEKPAEKKQKQHNIIIFCLTFFALCLSSRIIFFLFCFIQNTPNTVLAEAPAGIFEQVSLILSVIIAALYEESLFRIFLPNALIELFELFSPVSHLSRQKKICRIIVEIAVICLFALAHRYLGLPAVLNALFCGIILRICFILTGSIFIPVIAHSAYNLLAIMMTII